MRIVYLKTRNFADIYVGMNKKEFELDLSKQKNRIILLIGPVGSGKTSILSKLNPFAYPGNMDVRNGPEIILEGEDGYKEIHYSHNGALYVIKHYYQFSSGKGVKSFISRDGTELNPNGNVSSFKEVVDIELSIEPDLMTLLRLGSNVTGLIDKKSTERKAFATELLKDISIYLQLYKKVTNDSRTMKTMLKMVYDRLRQLDISDINIELAKLANNEVELNNAKNEHVKLITKLGESTGTMEQIHPGGYDQLIKEYDDVKYRIKSLNDELNKLNSLRDHINIIIDKNDIDIMITNMAETINRLSNTITVNTASIEFFQTQLNGLLNQRDEKLESKKYISSTGSKKELMIYKERVQAELVDYEKKFENFTPKITVDELKRVVEILGEIEEVIGVITHFGIRRVDETISLRLSGENIDSYVKRHVTEIDSEMSKLTYQLNKQSVSNNIEYDGQYPVLFAHDGCDCPYRKYFNEQKEATKDTTVKDREKLIKRRDSLDEIRESVLSMLDINKNLDFIQLIIRSNRELISRSPVSDIFSIDHIYQSIRIGKPIYDINTITQYMSLLEKYADFKAKKERLIEVERELEFLKKIILH